MATSVDVPPPPVSDLTDAGYRRVRHNRTVAVCVGVAAVLVAIVGAGLGPRLMVADRPVSPVHHGPSPVPRSNPPTTLADLPPGPPPRVYWHDGVLHVGEARIRTPLHDIVTGGDTVLVGHVSGADPSRWMLVDGDRLVPVAQQPTGFFPMVSADGRLVVWETIHPQVTRITAWDVASQHALDHRDVQIQQASCCGGGPSLMLFGADAQGQVFYGDGRTLTAWTPATEEAHTVTGYGHLPAIPSTVAAFGLVFQGRGPSMFDSPGVFGTVDGQGVFHRAGHTPIDSGVWSPDGTLFAYAADSSGAVDNKNPRTTVYVMNTRSGQDRRMELPPGTGGPMAWDGSSSLLVQAGTPLDRDLHVLRCDAATGACEVALRYQHYRRWSFRWR